MSSHDHLCLCSDQILLFKPWQKNKTFHLLGYLTVNKTTYQFTTSILWTFLAYSSSWLGLQSFWFIGQTKTKLICALGKLICASFKNLKVSTGQTLSSENALTMHHAIMRKKRMCTGHIDECTNLTVISCRRRHTPLLQYTLGAWYTCSIETRSWIYRLRPNAD